MRLRWFFEQIKKIDKFQLDYEKREKTQINEIRNDRQNIAIDNTKILKIKQSNMNNYILTNR